MLRSSRLGIVVIAAGLLAGCSTSRPVAEGPVQSISNFRQVAPQLYCGGQPSPQGLEELESIGVKTIVNLRTGFWGVPPPGKPFEEIRIPVVPVAMNDAQVEDFLRAVEAADKPVFFHCMLGADRTGAMIAAYRMVVQGWAREDALREMTQEDIQIGLFCHGLVDYVRQMDAEAMRTRLGLPTPARPAPGWPGSDPNALTWTAGTFH